MGFVKFTEVGKGFQPRAIVSAGGVISFNLAAQKKFNLDHWSHCVMYLDPDAHKVGFELVNDPDLDGANPLRRFRSDFVDINAGAFCGHFELHFRERVSFRVTRDLETDWLVLRLDEGETGTRALDDNIEDDEPTGKEARHVEKPPIDRPIVITRVAAASRAKNQDFEPNETRHAHSPASPLPRRHGVRGMISELLTD